MKKIIFSAFIALIAFVSTNAQDVITNNYDSPITSADGQSVNTNSTEEDESFGGLGLMYYSFDGFENYGLNSNYTNPNGVGLDFGVRAQFKDHGNFNFDLLFNYSFGLWKQDSNQLLLTLAAGPSLRTQDEISGFDKRGNIEYNSDKFFIDAVVNPRLTVKFGKIYITGGYFYWAPKFKFSKDDGATGGFNIGIGIAY